MRILRGPKPHRREITLPMYDHVSIIPTPIFDYLKHTDEGRKYLSFHPNASCPCNGQVAAAMRLFTNTAKGCAFLRPFPVRGGVHTKRFKRINNVLCEWVKSKRIQPKSLLETATEMDKAAAISGVTAELGLNAFMRNPKKYTKIYEDLCTEYSGGTPIDGVFMLPNHILRKLMKVRCFSKFEMLDPQKYPRNVSPRHPTFNLVWAQFVRPVEHELFENLTANGHFAKYCDARSSKFKNRWVAKGLNKVQIGILIHQKYQLFMELWGVVPIVISTDCTGFDSHCDDIELELGDEVLRIAYAQGTYAKSVEYICKRIGCNTVIAEGILAIWLRAIMSGDMQTAVIAVCMIVRLCVASANHARVRRFDLLIGGDDTLVFVHPDDYENLRGAMLEVFCDAGHELKIESVARKIEEIRFCQTMPLPVYIEGLGDTYTTVQNPYRIFGTMGSHVHARNKADATDFFDQIYLSYSVAYNYIPMFANLRPPDRLRRVAALTPGLMLDVNATKRYKITANAATQAVYCEQFNWPISLYDSNMHLTIPDPSTGVRYLPPTQVPIKIN